MRHDVNAAFYDECNCSGCERKARNFTASVQREIAEQREWDRSKSGGKRCWICGYHADPKSPDGKLCETHWADERMAAAGL